MQNHDDRNVPFDSLARRTFMKRAGLGCGSIALMSLLKDAGCLQAANAGQSDARQLPLPHHAAKATSLIWLFMPGGVSQMDTFDYKPALKKYDGQALPGADPKTGFFTTTGKILKSPFKFQQYGETGTWVSSVFPNVAEHVDDLALVYSCYTNSNNHTPSMLEMNSGVFLQGRPCLGSWLTYGLGNPNTGLPSFILMHGQKPRGEDILWSSGFLPRVYEPTTIDGRSKVPIANLSRSNSMTDRAQRAFMDGLKSMDDLHRQRHPLESDLAARVESFELAYRMQAAAPIALDLTQESKATQAQYGIDGKHTDLVGRQCLMARRLVERGVRCVQIYAGADIKPLGGDVPWDAHRSILSNHEENGLAVDQPIAALLQDLKVRGLFDSTLVVWGGEFGRTSDSQITPDGSNGRDHNPHASTLWMAGGGIRGGARCGATDEFGYKAVENRVGVNDLHATILHLLGIDHERLTYQFNGRDYRLTDVGGHIIQELLV